MDAEPGDDRSDHQVLMPALESPNCRRREAALCFVLWRTSSAEPWRRDRARSAEPGRRAEAASERAALSSLLGFRARIPAGGAATCAGQTTPCAV